MKKPLDPTEPPHAAERAADRSVRADLDGRTAAASNAAARGEGGDYGARPGGAMSAVGRNDPCPCGSGKKYKKCCLGTAPAIAASARPIRTVPDLDGQVVATIGRWAADRFGEAYARQRGPLQSVTY
jgi:SEC-C motif